MLWARRARWEHDVFADTLRERGVHVHYLADLLAETLKIDRARAQILDHTASQTALGPTLAAPVRSELDDMDSTTLTRHLIGGLTKAELGLPAHSLLLSSLDGGDFVLPPLPNHLFTRDPSAWIHKGVTLHPMAKPARRRETEPSTGTTRCSPARTSRSGIPAATSRCPPSKAATSTSSVTA